MDHRERLCTLLVERSLRTGDFTLASGARSTYYIDARRTTMCAEGQFLTGMACWAALQESGHSVSHVGGLTMGADPLAYALAHRSWLEGRPLDAFSVRKEPKGHGTGQQIEGGLPEGARCLVLEDSMTTGSSTLRAIDALDHFGATVVAVMTLVDREEGARSRIEEAGYPLISIFTASELLSLGDSPAT